MDIQGTSGVAYTLQIKSAQMSNDMQKQEGQAVLQLLEAAAPAPAPTSGSAGSIINTYA
ncbi:hypothetical protein KJ365_05450 [Glaciecola sp. XM2]|uniref:hypothetical protein n=1 Tax=Glaciecola sp. XM2 TaxID=1914931 RepID=UPI001BDF3B27|nr:hypothetical protein [Glaciecola sp. XM2]MBT1450319.1 hypothetical protein [Glaciecola sp. XM2]